MTAHQPITAGDVAWPHWEEAIALLSHPDARPYNLELTRLSTGYGARIFPPQTQHLRGNYSRLSGSFYGVAETPREAVGEAVSYWSSFQAAHRRACEMEDSYGHH